MRDFEKRFNRTRRFISIFIGATFVFIIAWWVVAGVIGVSIVNNPDVVGEKVGRFVKEVKSGWDEGYEVEILKKDTVFVNPEHESR